ncbi:proteasome subunit beta [Candidatus Woesearchaeota archaeon]|nr:proteasome subunit beta [Candidatus Woesearchaeota archaeon]
MTERYLKTGTTTVGIKCKDGIVLAADKRAGGGIIVDKRAQKVYQITNNIALTMAGVASDAQLITKLIGAELRLMEIRKEKPVTVKEAANLLSGIVYQNIRKMSTIPGISHFLLGGKDNTGFHIFDIYPDGSLSECKDFLSSGSGSVMAYGVLETLFIQDMTIQEGIQLAVKCLNAAIQRDMNSGDGIDVMTITEQGVKKVVTKEFTQKVTL